MKKTALSVGNCAMDEANLRKVLAREFDADLVAVDSADQALAKLAAQSFDLVLINRVFDQDGGHGMDLIRRIKTDAKLQAHPVMLISNYPDFQNQAEQLGATPGVGKSTLSTKESLERLRVFLGAEPPAGA